MEKNHSIGLTELEAGSMLKKYASLGEIEAGLMQGIIYKYVILMKIIPP